MAGPTLYENLLASGGILRPCRNGKGNNGKRGNHDRLHGIPLEAGRSEWDETVGIAGAFHNAEPRPGETRPRRIVARQLVEKRLAGQDRPVAVEIAADPPFGAGKGDSDMGQDVAADKCTAVRTPPLVPANAGTQSLFAGFPYSRE
jgi:hypothetical protein